MRPCKEKYAIINYFALINYYKISSISSLHAFSLKSRSGSRNQKSSLLNMSVLRINHSKYDLPKVSKGNHSSIGKSKSHGLANMYKKPGATFQLQICFLKLGIYSNLLHKE